MKIELSSTSFALLILSIAFVMTSYITVEKAQASDASVDITRGNNTAWFGGEKIGSLSFVSTDKDITNTTSSGSAVNITALLDIMPPQGKDFEAWLLDPISNSNTYANLSLGHFANGSLNFDQFMVNPGVYQLFVVSEEPTNDTDSRISNIIVGGTKVNLTSDKVTMAGQ